MNRATARRELREARAKGFCEYCFAKGPRGFLLDHQADCKIVSQAGVRRRRRSNVS